MDVVQRVADGGLEVVGLSPEGPAARAGIEIGDCLIALSGTRVVDCDALLALTREMVVGETWFAVIERDGERREVRGVAAAQPSETIGVGSVILGEVGEPGARLRTISTIPEGEGPHPGVLFLGGLSSRSFEFPHEPEHAVMRFIEGLTRAGFVTLRVERSGVGDSEGPPCSELGLAAELRGCRMGLDALASAPYSDPKRLFAFGHSLGGMNLPLLARELASPAFRAIAVFGTSARRWNDAALDAARRSLELGGFEGARLEEAIAGLERLQRRVYLGGATPEEAFRAEPDLRKYAFDSYVGSSVFGRTATFFRELQELDLEGAFRNVACPLLALHGAHDWMVTFDDARHIASLARNGRATSLPGVDHAMRATESTEWSFRNRSGGALAPELLGAVVNFYGEHCG